MGGGAVGDRSMLWDPFVTNRKGSSVLYLSESTDQICDVRGFPALPYKQIVDGESIPGMR